MLKFIKQYLDKFHNIGFLKEFSKNKAEKLEYYFVLHLFSSAIYTAVQKIVPSDEEYPARPDGGAWIAAGTKYPRDFDFENYKFGKYCYGGERRAYFENFLGSRYIELHVYDTQPDLNRYEHGPVQINDDNLAKMLYIISRGIPFDNTGFNLMFLEDIPHLTECSILAYNDGHVCVDIPMLSNEEYKEIDKIRIEQMRLLADLLQPKLRKIFPKLKVTIPKHLNGRIAEFRQYLCDAIPMAFIKLAKEKDDLSFIKSTPPMVFVVDDENRGIR